MSYLIPNDYLRFIQEIPLQQVISKNPIYQSLFEQTAQEDFREYLSQKYDLNQEFTDTVAYSPTAAYHAGDRVYLDAPLYDATKTYAAGVLTLYGGSIYACNTAIVTPEAFNPGKWTLLGSQYDIFYAKYPYDIFSINDKWYSIGDKVMWKNHIYTALQPSMELSHGQELQYYNSRNVPFQNVFPDDVLNGAQYWKDEGEYIVPAGNLLTQNPATYVQFTSARKDLVLKAGVTPGFNVGNNSYTDDSLIGWSYNLERVGSGTMDPAVDYETILNGIAENSTKANGWKLLAVGDVFQVNEKFILHFLPIVSETAPLNPTADLTSQQLITTYFIKGDNRNQKVLQHYVSLVLYYLYRRIAPKSIPEERTNAYKEAQQWLKMAMQGDIKPNVTEIQPPKGNRIRGGSNIKQQNSY